MHLIKIPEGISAPIPVQGGIPLEAGKEYICTNAFAGSMRLPGGECHHDEMWSPELSGSLLIQR
jgi:hypothetical protein